MLRIVLRTSARAYALAVLITAIVALAAPSAFAWTECELYAMFCNGGPNNPTTTYEVSGKQPAAAYSGWAYVYGQRVCSNGSCYVYESSPAAYSWSAGKWTTTSRPDRLKIWVTNFSGEWRWTWTSNTGWLAMLASRISTESPALGGPAPTPTTCDDYARYFHFC